MVVFVIGNYPSNYVIDKGGICVAVSIYFYISSLFPNHNFGSSWCRVI